jgi:thioredoxin-related protein
MNNLSKRIELVANIAIIIVALILAAVLVKRYLLPNAEPNQVATDRSIKAGTKLSVDGVDWAKNERTLVLALSTECRYCTESAPFYQRLAQKRSEGVRIKLVAVLPQEISQSQKYLNDHRITVDDVKQARPSSLGVAGTPTLIIADRTGTVTKSWVGKLPAEKEAEVLTMLQ